MSKVSYRAEGPIRELYITVAQRPGGSVVSLTWSTRETGDTPGQGKRGTIQRTSGKPVRSIAHAVNLAAWVTRLALQDMWDGRRGGL